jgi:hypothetical protein
MLSNDSANTSLNSDAKAGTAASVRPMKPGDVIEVAASGTGTVDDPVAKDTKPPGVYDLDLLA